MTVRRRLPALVPALTGALLLVAGCGGDEPLTTPPVAQEPPSPVASSASPTPPTPSASPSPSPPPLSAYEDDPAVQALRGYLAAAAAAINAGDVQLPALVEASTARRAQRHAVIYAEELGHFFPGPRPVAVMGVRVVSPTARNVLTCSLEDGHALDRPGGTPLEPARVVGGQFELVLQDGRWKVDRAASAEDVSCGGVRPPQAPA